ncbi:MAG TPA: CvpA family protein [Pseudomonadales bacterium]
MAIVDIIILGVVLLSCLFGAFRGLVKEALSLAFWIGAAVLASVFSDALALRLGAVSDSAMVRQIVAFVLIFVFTVFAGGLLSNLISRLMSRAGLGGVDRALGALFGIIRGLVIVTIVVMLTARFPATREPYSESVLMPYIMVLAGFFEDLFGMTADAAPAATGA